MRPVLIFIGSRLLDVHMLGLCHQWEVSVPSTCLKMLPFTKKDEKLRLIQPRVSSSTVFSMRWPSFHSFPGHILIPTTYLKYASIRASLRHQFLGFVIRLIFILKAHRHLNLSLSRSSKGYRKDDCIQSFCLPLDLMSESSKSKSREDLFFT